MVTFVLIWIPPALAPAGLIVRFLVVVAVDDIATVAVVLDVSALFRRSSGRPPSGAQLNNRAFVT